MTPAQSVTVALLLALIGAVGVRGLIGLVPPLPVPLAPAPVPPPVIVPPLPQPAAGVTWTPPPILVPAVPAPPLPDRRRCIAACEARHFTIDPRRAACAELCP
jgi:hypothetical protein